MQLDRKHIMLMCSIWIFWFIEEIYSL